MEAKCYRAMRRAQCIVLKKFSQHVIAETLTRKKTQVILHTSQRIFLWALCYWIKCKPLCYDL